MTKEQILYTVWNWVSGYAVNYDDQTDAENSKTLAYISGVCNMAEKVMRMMGTESD